MIRTVQAGQLITVYAVTTGFYGQQKHVNSTDQTLIEINQVQQNQRILTIVGYDNIRDDKKVEVISDLGELYTITQDIWRQKTVPCSF